MNAILKLYGAVVCKFRGHMRGVEDKSAQTRSDMRVFRCPRCHATWTRKVTRKTTEVTK